MFVQSEDLYLLLLVTIILLKWKKVAKPLKPKSYQIYLSDIRKLY